MSLALWSMNALEAAPHTKNPHHRSLVASIDFSTAVDTIDHGELFGMLDRLPRLGPRTKRWLNNSLRGRYVRVCSREQHSRKQLTPAGVPQGSVLGPQLFFYCVDDLLHRMGNIYSAPALMHADDLALVASGADIHACAAAMQPSLSLTTTWATEHSPKINVDKSEAAAFYISSHTRSDEEMVDLLLGNGNLRIQSCPVRLLGTTIDRLPNFDYARFHRYKADHATLLSIAAGRTGWCVPSHHAILFNWIRPRCVTVLWRDTCPMPCPHLPP
ncbi:hypothetical protein C3747_86g14 [Trypanosoma cruzi]|uniref:Reverse transcriptase domain-containing protein n=1 Tax=Trypanosoma cruzi TaxID=5693 RepID=A0A2V2WJI9_TRYCR|nr:hypothetical protein C3747_86g14 [Trypanosoma cruzi]